MTGATVLFWIILLGTLLVGVIVVFSWVLVQKKVPWWENIVASCGKTCAPRGPASRRILHYTILLGAACLAFAAAVLAIYGLAQLWPGPGGLVAFDQAVYSAVDDAVNGWIVTLLLVVTRSADVLTVCILSGLVALILLWRGYRWTTLALVMNIAGGMAITWVVKMVAGRARPEGGLIGTAGESFPSGHASLSMLMYGFLIYMVWRFLHIRWAQIALTIVLVLLIGSIGLSRVILSVHWTSDVIGGYVLGLSWLLYSLAIARVLREASHMPVKKDRSGRVRG